MSSKQVSWMVLACVLTAGCGNGGSEPPSADYCAVPADATVSHSTVSVHAEDASHNLIQGIAMSYAIVGGASYAAQCSDAVCSFAVEKDGFYALTITKVGYEDVHVWRDFAVNDPCGQPSEVELTVTMQPQ